MAMITSSSISVNARFKSLHFRLKASYEVHELHRPKVAVGAAGVLRTLTDKPIIKAFRIQSQMDLELAASCGADSILLDAGKGDGVTFDWELLNQFSRPYFLAGGLDTKNVRGAVERFHPYAVDVSSGIETDGLKDPEKMAAFVEAVRKESL